MGVVPPEPGFLEALRSLCGRLGRAARLRRGDHGLPRRARRCAGALRRHAGPDDPRQDRRRRPPARGLRRPGRRDGAARAGRRRLPGGDALGESRSPRRPASPCCGGCASRRFTRSSNGWACGWRRGSRRSGRVQRVGAMLTLFCREQPVTELRRRCRGGHRSVRGPLPAPAGAGDLRRAVAVRGHVRLAGARGRGDRRARSRPLPTSTPDLWDAIALRGGRRERALARGASPRAGARAARDLLRALRRAPRARPGDRLRGLPRPLRAAAAVRARRRRYGPAPRRLPVRARARPDRCFRERRGRARAGRADLALRLSARRERRRRRRRRAWAETAVRLGTGARDPAAVDRALAVHRARMER